MHITLDHDDIPPPRPYGPWPRPPPREAAVEKPLPRSPLREKFMGRDAASDAGEPAAERACDNAGVSAQKEQLLTQSIQLKHGDISCIM